MDRIFIRDLLVDAVIGVYDWEQRIQRPLRFDLEIATHTQTAARSGRIEDTINYAAVAERIRSIVTREPHTLLETLAEEIATVLLAEFGGESIRLTIAKPAAIAGAREVGVCIERQATAPGA